ncbi:hypothetical protein ABI59_06750 [Acidobacteria bacterium Mor1]|nr:hypothetical protein ABI59_06750 [Acidobacteria bacterium Mor1]
MGELMISPPLTRSIELPFEQYDEWYFVDSAEFPIPAPEVFVNYIGFSLVPARDIHRREHLARERSQRDALEQMQGRFWDQLARISPVTYVASGELFFIATRDNGLMGAVCGSSKP